MWGHGFNGFGGFGWAGMLFGGLMMLLFWGGLIALIFFAVRSFAQSSSGQDRAHSTGVRSSGGNALDVLKERYARGEITKEEFEDIRRDLEKRDRKDRG